MGLCKCPKRQVTNQFCFEHRVNVCEYCLVRQHKRCIVQSYLQWLKDSDYDATCKYCGDFLQDEIKDQECVRLMCYHVFHWDCLNNFQMSLPIDTTPSGRKCPICADPIIPPTNTISPVCEVLRTQLSQVNWGRYDLGMPLIVQEGKSSNMKQDVKTTDKRLPATRNTLGVTGQEESHKREIDHTTLTIDNGYKRMLTARQPPIGSSDRDENKYKKRTPQEIFSRWSRRLYTPASRPFYKRKLILVVVMLVVLFVFGLASFGRRLSNDNPMLNMDMNPNIINHE